MTTETLSLKLCKIMGALETLPKNGFNAFNNYSYVKESDVTDAIRKLLAQHNVLITPSYQELKEENLAKGLRTTVKVQYDVINAEKPEEKISLFSYGIANDMGDKGLYKAMTGAHKYLMLKLFNLSADDDPEGDTQTDMHAAGQTMTKKENIGGAQPQAQNQTQGIDTGVIVPKEYWDNRDVLVLKTALEAAGKDTTQDVFTQKVDKNWHIFIGKQEKQERKSHTPIDKSKARFSYAVPVQKQGYDMEKIRGAIKKLGFRFDPGDKLWHGPEEITDIDGLDFRQLKKEPVVTFDADEVPF